MVRSRSAYIKFGGKTVARRWLSSNTNGLRSAVFRDFSNRAIRMSWKIGIFWSTFAYLARALEFGQL